jgi:hypothetical protein
MIALLSAFASRQRVLFFLHVPVPARIGTLATPGGSGAHKTVIVSLFSLRQAAQSQGCAVIVTPSSRTGKEIV